MDASLREAEVKRIALAMDADQPGWASKIDQNILFRSSVYSLRSSTSNCIQDQVYGGYSTEIETRLIGEDKIDPEIETIPSELSPFWVDFIDDEEVGSTEERWNMLRALWATEIEARVK